MGQTLSEPAVDKRTTHGEDDTLLYACSDMQGWRLSMEDAHATILSLNGRSGDEKASFFAVYDGHGGSAVAEVSAQTVHRTLVATEQYQHGDYAGALKRAFLQTDEQLRVTPRYAADPSGCTAVAALLVKTPKTPGEQASEAPVPGKPHKVARRLYVANAGDSRCVLSVQGEAKAMSHDHKPGNRAENERIVAAGGFVEMGRVNGNLALSRALGDFEFKQNPSLPPERQIVTADPEIEVHDMRGDEEFLVLACDGIWDCLSRQQVVDLVRRGLAEGKEPYVLCEEIMDKCLAPAADVGGIGCDNMTIEIVALLGGRTKEEYYAWIKQRVETNVGWHTPETVPEVFRSRGGSGLQPEDPAAGDWHDYDEEDDDHDDDHYGATLRPAAEDSDSDGDEDMEARTKEVGGTRAESGHASGTGQGKRKASSQDHTDHADHAEQTPTGGETPELVTSPTALEIPDKGPK